MIRDGVLVICPGSVLNASPQHTQLTYAYNSYPHITIIPFLPFRCKLSSMPFITVQSRVVVVVVISLLQFFPLSLSVLEYDSRSSCCILCVIYPPIYLLFCTAATALKIECPGMTEAPDQRIISYKMAPIVVNRGETK